MILIKNLEVKKQTANQFFQVPQSNKQTNYNGEPLDTDTFRFFFQEKSLNRQDNSFA